MAVSAAILTRVPAAFLPLKPSLNSNRTNRKNRTKSEEKPPKQAVFLRKVVRVTGFEPAASCSQSRRATNCATPGYKIGEWPIWRPAGPDGALPWGAFRRVKGRGPAGLGIHLVPRGFPGRVRARGGSGSEKRIRKKPPGHNSQAVFSVVGTTGLEPVTSYV